MEKGKIIAVTSVKGGTGKTTTLLNLAGVYKDMNKKVLIMDFDLYECAIANSLNLNVKSDLSNLIEDISNNKYEYLDDYITPYVKNIDVLSAPTDPRSASRVNSGYFGIIFDKVILKYDVILIDTNYFMNDINLTTFDSCDKILYVLTTNPIDLTNMKTMIGIYNDLGKNNYEIVLNRSIYKNKDLFTNYNIKSFIGEKIYYSIPESFRIDDIDNYVYSGKILSLDKKIRLKHKKTIKIFELLATDLLKGE